MESIEDKFLKKFSKLRILKVNWNIDNLNLLIKQIFQSSDEKIFEFQSFLEEKAWIEFESNQEKLELKFPDLCELIKNYYLGWNYSNFVLNFRKIKSETGFKNVPNQFHHLINLVGKWSISDDDLRWEMIHCMTEGDKEEINNSLNTNDDFFEWMYKTEKENTDDIYLFICYHMIFQEI